MKKTVLCIVAVFLTMRAGAAVAFEITSTAFANGGAIPTKYTCDGTNISPPLSWKDPPDGTLSYLLIVDDPDAPFGSFVHWMIWNIPRVTTSLREGMEKVLIPVPGMTQGKSDFKKTGYDGPCPPSGTHHYYFRLYALKVLLGVDADVTKAKLEEEAKPYVIDQTSLMGTYTRAKK